MRLPALLTLSLLAPAAFAQSASVAGTDGTNVLGSVPCAALASAALSNCPAELLRKGDGKATVRVLMPGGRTRSLYFENAQVTSSDSTDPVRGKTAGGTKYVFVGEDERFEIPAQAFD